MEKKQKQLEEGYVDRSGNRQQGFWQEYIQNGAQVMRHDHTIDSARKIVDKIIIGSTPIYIQIQNELHAGEVLSQTTAGQAIKRDLDKDTERMKEELTKLKVKMENALKNTNKNKDWLKQQYEEQISSLEGTMAEHAEGQRKLDHVELKELIQPRREWLQDAILVATSTLAIGTVAFLAWKRQDSSSSYFKKAE